MSRTTVMVFLSPTDVDHLTMLAGTLGLHPSWRSLALALARGTVHATCRPGVAPLHAVQAVGSIRQQLLVAPDDWRTLRRLTADLGYMSRRSDSPSLLLHAIATGDVVVTRVDRTPAPSDPPPQALRQ